jgi:GNAT superfamily N-acetyltransferase
MSNDTAAASQPSPNQTRPKASAGLLGLVAVSVGTATFELLRSRAALWPPIAATALGAGVTALLLWSATRPKRTRRFPRGYEIRAARAHDLPALAAIERDAAAAYAEYLSETGLTRATLARVAGIRDLETAMNDGRLWVATHRNRPVAFAWVEPAAGYAHIEEVDVHPAHARRGIGRALIEAVSDWATSHDLRGVTLTTFRDVPWNTPYYERLGFAVVDPASISPGHVEIVRREAAQGLDTSKRVTMIRHLERQFRDD